MLDPENKVPKAYIDEIISKSEIKTCTYFGNCLVMAAKLPNGFVVVTSSGCIDPANFSREIGKEICMEHLRDEVWKLEGYVGTNDFLAKSRKK